MNRAGLAVVLATFPRLGTRDDIRFTLQKQFTYSPALIQCQRRTDDCKLHLFDVHTNRYMTVAFSHLLQSVMAFPVDFYLSLLLHLKQRVIDIRVIVTVL